MPHVIYGALGITCVGFGAVIAYLADRLPRYTEGLLIIAGIVPIGGLALVGWHLPRIERF
jgi:hypothetical protein